MQRFAVLDRTPERPAGRLTAAASAAITATIIGIKQMEICNAAEEVLEHPYSRRARETLAVAIADMREYVDRRDLWIAERTLASDGVRS